MLSTERESAAAREQGAREPAEPERPARRRRMGLFAGLALFALVLAAPTGMPAPAQRTAAVAVLMATWWMTEALPLAATSLLPIVLFPLLGVLRPEPAAAPYANPVIFLFMGGFLLALAMERWGLHRRLALAVVASVGVQPRRLVLGFMLATAFISLWISNTATAAMMLPIGLALAELLRPREPDAAFPFGTALMLGIAYGATIGGVGTLIGTPPNAVFAAAARELAGREIGFAEWMKVGLPVVALLLPITWALLVYVLFPPGQLPAGAAALLAAERERLGPATRGERLTAAVFALTALGWLVREPKQIGGLRIPGLADLAPGLDDSTIAMGGALLLFLLPVDWRKGEFVLDWGAARRLPWGVLLLFGGGLSLARAFEESGLTALVAQAVAGLAGLPAWLLLAIVVATLIFVSELTSNTALAAMAMPLLAAAAVGVGQDPLVLMAAGALAASTAFMLPVGTPPNALVFGTGYVRMGEMVKAGFGLNLISIVLVTVVAYLVVGWAFG
ncbi:MAG TPA: SLC13 family permease [Longimicrobiales bacterium]